MFPQERRSQHSLSGPVLKTTCDDELTVYFGGKEHSLNEANDWRIMKVLAIPPETGFLRLRCKDIGGDRGLHASIRVPLVRKPILITDSSWVCSDVHEVGWSDLDFDDSLWGPAKVVDHEFTEVMAWSQSLKGDTVFCRLKITEGLLSHTKGIVKSSRRLIKTDALSNTILDRQLTMADVRCSGKTLTVIS